MRLSRRRFIEGWAAWHKNAKNANISTRLAFMGMCEWDGQPYFALPCACGAELCEGWAMNNAKALEHHLTFNAPANLRAAYLEAIKESGGQ